MIHKLLAAALTCAVLSAGPKAAQAIGEINLPSKDIKLAPADPKDPKGPQFGPVWGDMTKEPNGLMIRLPAGFKSNVHVHSADYRGVVISGVLINAQAEEKEPIKLPTGSYWFQPAKAKHYTACEPGADCLAYVQFMGPFDSKPEP